jgi:hypothetical protein
VHDADALDFIRGGPRNPAEALAFAQGVALDSDLVSERAPAEMQARFQRSGEIATDRHFVGPNGRVYLRGENILEPESHHMRTALMRVLSSQARLKRTW